MNALLVIIFIGSLVYLSTSVNIKTYINIIGLQGLVLFGVAIHELNDLSFFHLGFVLLETLVFKAIAVPYILYRLSKRNKIISLKNNRAHRVTKGFNLIVISSVVIVGAFLLSNGLHDDHLDVKYFTAAVSSIVMGLVFIIINKNIVIHIISYLVIENGIFLLAIAIGADMPMMINAAILLDIFASVLVLGVFFNRLGQHFTRFSSSELNQLKD